MSQNVSPTIPNILLQGHQAPVLCLDHSSSLRNDGSATTGSDSHGPILGCLLSGSEDGTARLWDLRTGNMRAAMCIVVGMEVASVAFAPPLRSTDDTLSTINNSPFARNYCVYLSSGSHVNAYDLRRIQSPIVREPPDIDLSTILGSTDEVNQISLSPWWRSPIFLAAGDDEGAVRVVDTTSLSFGSSPQSTTTGWPQNKRPATSQCTTLLHDPTCMAIVTSTSFRPRSKGWELASGGTDCCVNVWDVTKPKRPLCSYRITPDPLSSDTANASTNQVCNPPMVHSLSWSPSGRVLAVGLGDGTCRVLRVEGRSSVEVARLDIGLSAPIASVLFPEWSTSTTACGRHVAAQDRLLTSVGNDGAILGWDLGSVVIGDGAHDPSLMIEERVLQAANLGKQDPTDLSNALMGLSMQVNDDDHLYRPPYILFRIQHGHKPNWMTSSRGYDSAFPSTLFVADTSNDITAYTIPLR